MESINNLKDHDILVRLDQRVSDLQQAVKDLNDGTHSKIASLEKDKADRKDVEALQVLINEKIEVRVRKLELSNLRYITTSVLYGIAIGALYTLTVWHIISTQVISTQVK